MSKLCVLGEPRQTGTRTRTVQLGRGLSLEPLLPRSPPKASTSRKVGQPAAQLQDEWFLLCYLNQAQHPPFHHIFLGHSGPALSSLRSYGRCHSGRPLSHYAASLRSCACP